MAGGEGEEAHILNFHEIKHTSARSLCTHLHGVLERTCQVMRMQHDKNIARHYVNSPRLSEEFLLIG